MKTGKELIKEVIKDTVDVLSDEIIDVLAENITKKIGYDKVYLFDVDDIKQSSGFNPYTEAIKEKENGEKIN